MSGGGRENNGTSSDASNDPHATKQIKQAMSNQDLDYFEQMI